MAKKNDDFFKEKKPWSEVKDELLGHYLKPYFQKILHTRRTIVYVDCFAGKGAFEDGKPGSPLIALHTIEDCLSQTTIRSNIRPWNCRFVSRPTQDGPRRSSSMRLIIVMEY